MAISRGPPSRIAIRDILVGAGAGAGAGQPVPRDSTPIAAESHARLAGGDDRSRRSRRYHSPACAGIRRGVAPPPRRDGTTLVTAIVGAVRAAAAVAAAAADADGASNARLSLA